MFSSEFSVFHVSSRPYCTGVKRNWCLYSAVCLERKPTIIKDFNQLEKKYKKFLEEVEFEKSYKSDHECRVEEDDKRLTQLKLQDKLKPEVLAGMAKQTAKEVEISCTEELSQFEMAPRITEADNKNDVKSLNRKLDRHLLLLISEKQGDEMIWTLPKGILNEKETMREAAERILREKCGESLKVTFLGNAPVGFYKYKYPKSLKLNTEGAKVFFFKAIYKSGQVRLKDGFDYQWATQDELKSALNNERYLRKVRRFLISDRDYLEEMNEKFLAAKKVSY